MVIKRIIEEKISLPKGVNLEGLTIQDELYDLVVKNEGERLELQFYKKGEGRLNGASPEFAIRIHEDGMFFERYLYRPRHDHDDSETLQTKVEENDLVWSREPTYGERRNKLFKIPFGSGTDSY